MKIALRANATRIFVSVPPQSTPDEVKSVLSTDEVKSVLTPDEVKSVLHTAVAKIATAPQTGRAIQPMNRKTILIMPMIIHTIIRPLMLPLAPMTSSISAIMITRNHRDSRFPATQY